jgi:hypothetical protein
MKIVMVLTSHDVLGNTGRKTGFWLEEFAAPYFVLNSLAIRRMLTRCTLRSVSHLPSFAP